jgi:hypothetical protein
MNTHLQVEVVVQMKIVEIFAMNKQVEHVVTLPAHLQSRLDPVKCGCLEEFGSLERSE